VRQSGSDIPPLGQWLARQTRHSDQNPLRYARELAFTSWKVQGPVVGASAHLWKASIFLLSLEGFVQAKQTGACEMANEGTGTGTGCRRLSRIALGDETMRIFCSEVRCGALRLFILFYSSSTLLSDCKGGGNDVVVLGISGLDCTALHCTHWLLTD
jgi:hypothetical protein